MSEGIKKTFSVVGNILVWIIILFAAIVIIATISSGSEGIPKILGYSMHSIQSDSMKAPEGETPKKDNFKKGDLVVTKKVEPETLKQGDVVVFWDVSEEKFIIHRIVKINKVQNFIEFETKGDANTEKDSFNKTALDIEGKYQSQMPGMGKVLDFIGGKWGFLFCLVIPLFLFFVWRLIALFRAYKEFKDAGEDDDDGEDENAAEA